MDLLTLTHRQSKAWSIPDTRYNIASMPEVSDADKRLIQQDVETI
jgi:hypothetical protein